MNIKNWPNWLKGGVLLTLIGSICIALVYLIGDFQDGTLWQWILLMTTFPFVFGALFLGAAKASLVYAILFQLVLYFIIGAIIGFIGRLLNK